MRTNLAKLMGGKVGEYVVFLETCTVNYFQDKMPEYNLSFTLLKPESIKLEFINFTTNNSPTTDLFYRELATHICSWLDDGVVRVSNNDKYLINNGYTLIIGNAIRFLDMFKLHNCFETPLNESNLRIQLY